MTDPKTKLPEETAQPIKLDDTALDDAAGGTQKYNLFDAEREPKFGIKPLNID